MIRWYYGCSIGAVAGRVRLQKGLLGRSCHDRAREGRGSHAVPAKGRDSSAFLFEFV